MKGSLLEKKRARLTAANKTENQMKKNKERKKRKCVCVKLNITIF